MNTPNAKQGLYYPFHLCHERTLTRLLDSYASVHFRDFMAMQLSPMSGTTAYMDRMGDAHGELVRAGRIVQGYSVSGEPDAEIIKAVNRDLADPIWRSLFHEALQENRRFQRGLLDLSHGMMIGNALVPGPAAFLRLTEPTRRHRPVTFQGLQELSKRRLSLDEGYECEHALALVKTSASLAYTIRLSLEHGLEAVTDSEAHFQLFDRTCSRDALSLANRWLPREGY